MTGIAEASGIQIKVAGSTRYVGTLLGGGMADEDTGERQTVIVRNCKAENVAVTYASGTQPDNSGSLVGLAEYASIEQ